MNSKKRIIFYGTPEFAVPCLDILVQNGLNVIAVVTAPDKPSGRGQKIIYSAVKEYALSKNIPVLQPLRLKDENFLKTLRDLNPDLQIVVAFRMLPESVWSLPKHGTFNLHASLLPKYRGAAPINWAIINGENESGVTTFFLQHEIDTGDVIMQRKTLIDSAASAGELHDKLMNLGAELVLNTVECIESGEEKAVPQAITNKEEVPIAPKLNKDNTRLHKSLSYLAAYNFIRGLSPYPAAHAELIKTDTDEIISMKFFKSSAEKMQHDKEPGSIETNSKNFLRIYLSGGYIEILELQIAGKSRMSVKDFLNGSKLNGNWKLSI